MANIRPTTTTKKMLEEKFDTLFHEHHSYTQQHLATRVDNSIKLKALEKEMKLICKFLNLDFNDEVLFRSEQICWENK